MTEQPTQRHAPILDEYARRLNERVVRGEISASTRDTYLRDANRTFEAILSILPAEVIEAIKGIRFKGSYAHVIRDLKEIADERSRRTE